MNEVINVLVVGVKHDGTICVGFPKVINDNMNDVEGLITEDELDMLGEIVDRINTKIGETRKQRRLDMESE